MYGYVRPVKSELKMREYELYKAAYCGLCHSLSVHYGSLARYTVSFDMAFVLMLLQSGEQHPELCTRRCPAHPFSRRCAACALQGQKEVAAATVLLFCHKLRDNVRDERPLKSLVCRLLLLLFSRSFRRALRDMPELSAHIASCLEQLSALEAEGCTSVDRTADCFARLCQSLAPPSDAHGEALSRLLYHLGRVIFIVDAADDLPEDMSRGRFNALALRYGITSEQQREEHREDILRLCDLSLAEAAQAYMLLSATAFSPIVENVLLLGLPAELELALMPEREKKRLRKERKFSRRENQGVIHERSL